MIKELLQESIANIKGKDSNGRRFDGHNKVILSGTVCKELELEYVQKSTAIPFYRTQIICQQASGRTDIITIKISCQLKENLKETTIKGKYIEITGRLRSHRRTKENGETGLDLYVLASRIEVFDTKTQENDVNILYLSGFVCQDISVWEETGKIDFSILVYRKKKYQPMDFFPCIVKGNLASYYRPCLQKGKKISFEGTLQSREYPRNNENVEKKIAYEVRIKKMIEF